MPDMDDFGSEPEPIRLFLDINLSEIGVLPTGWQDDIRAASMCASLRVVHSLTSITNRHGSVGLDYAVIDGLAIRSLIPWLRTLYETAFLELAQSSTGRTLVISKLERSSININMHATTGSRYDWHVDSNPVTALLFATSLGGNEGGELVFDNGDGSRSLIEPIAGRFLVFDARMTPHTVMPLRRDVLRLSVPMNYFLIDEEESRPGDLDRFLYGEPSIEPFRTRLRYSQP